MSREPNPDDWFFRSDTGRGVQQQAAYFRALGKVLLEYVWNSLDNPDESAERTRCDVTFVDWQNKKKRSIVVSDNGCGMTKAEVQDQFLTLFRENERRRNKKWARGQYGTGKVAFLGIADTLSLSTVKNSERTTIRIHKATFKPGTERPKVEAVEMDVKTDEPNGTRVTISDLQDRKHGTDQAKELLRSELRRALQANDVYYQGDLLEFQEPHSAQEWIFDSPESHASLYGRTKFTIKDAGKKLEPQVRGFAVYTHQAMREFSMLDFDSDSTVQRLFGDVDVPKLENPGDPVPIATNSRDNRLNPENPRVAALHEWMRECILKVKHEIDSSIEERMAEEERRKLDRQSRAIENIINAHFKRRQRELRAAVAGAGSSLSTNREPTVDLGGRGPMVPIVLPEGAGTGEPAQPGELLMFGGTPTAPAESPAPTVADILGSLGTSTNEPPPRGTPDDAPPAVPEQPPMTAATSGSQPTGEKPTKRGRSIPEGGFQVKSKHFGPGSEEWRSQYNNESNVIFINLDYPQIAAARKKEGGVEGPFFQALIYEVAFSEYTRALARYLVRNNDPEVQEPEDVAIFIGNALNELCVSTASLFTEDEENTLPSDTGLNEMA